MSKPYSTQCAICGDQLAKIHAILRISSGSVLVCAGKHYKTSLVPFPPEYLGLASVRLRSRIGAETSSSGPR